MNTYLKNNDNNNDDITPIKYSFDLQENSEYNTPRYGSIDNRFSFSNQKSSFFIF